MIKMKRSIIAAATTSLLTLVFCRLVGCTDQLEPTPTSLVIESSDITGMYEGTISISGEGREEICVEGAIRIDEDGNQIHITMSDAVESLFDEEF